MIARRLSLLTTITIMALMALAQAAAAATPGSLTQLTGSAGCIVSAAGEGCAPGRFLTEVSATAVSPDGAFVYAASSGADTNGSVESFTRNPFSGALTQLSGASGCISSDGSDGNGASTCATGTGLRGAKAVVISPDGKFVYVASGGDTGSGTVNAIAIFSRNPATGALSQAAGTAGCVSPDDNQCTPITAPLGDVRSLAMDSQGKNLYATAGDNSSIVVFTRDATTGVVTQAQCFTPTASVTCTTAGRAIQEAYSVAVSPDDKNVYVAASEGTAAVNGSVVAFTRSSVDGKLTQIAGSGGCIDKLGNDGNGPGTCATGYALHDANTITISPNGDSVYVAAQGETGSTPPGVNGAVSVFSRDQATGVLTETACISEDGYEGDGTGPGKCAVARGLIEPTGLVVSPDNGNVYVASSDIPSAISVFSRDASGALSQLGGQDGCTSTNGTDGTGVSTCAVGSGLSGAAQLSVTSASATCQSVYVAAQDSSTVASFVRTPTCAAPTATTGTATAITSTGATVAGTANPNSAPTTAHFDYGTSTAYGSSSAGVSIGSGNAAKGVTAALTGLAPSTTYHYRLVAANARASVAGLDATFTTPAATVPPTAPKLTRLKLTPPAFLAARSGPSATASVRTARAKAKPAKSGTKVSFSLTISGSVRFTVQTRLPGRKTGKGKRARCAPVTKKNHTAAKCTRTVVLGSFVRSGKAGANTFHFTGRIKGHRLSPGAYRLVATPSASGHAGPAVSQGFRIRK